MRYIYKPCNTTHIFDVLTSRELQLSPCDKSPRGGDTTPVKMPFLKRIIATRTLPQGGC